MTERIPDDHVIVLFGATGDLAKRKLLPGLYHLASAGLLPKRYRIIGTSPASFAISPARVPQAREGLDPRVRHLKPSGETWKTFEAALDFGAADPDNPKPLLEAVAKARAAIGGHPRLLHHLAIPPVAFGSVVGMLGACGLNEDAHVIIEKPFGTDLASARALNETVHKVFDESCIFRIDHFLGKEAIDNILAFRFANGLFDRSGTATTSASADRRSRDAVHRGTRRVLRQDRRIPRHDRHAPAPGRRVRRDGTAVLARRRRRRAREDEGLRRDASDRCDLRWCEVSTRAFETSQAWRSAPRTETFIAVEILRRQLALGKACRSTCVRGRASPRAVRSSRWASRAPRSRCSRVNVAATHGSRRNGS